MTWELQTDRPIYLQLVEQLEVDIVSGRYQPGDKFPTVRELAAEAAVNPNTMQKAMAELEDLGLLYTQRTSGRYVTEETEKIRQIKIRLAEKQAVLFMEKMRRMGMTAQEILSLLTDIVKEDLK